jgi:threonine synthase
MGTLPRMIIVRAANNSPLVTAHRQGLRQPVPFTGFHTVAEAITSGNPLGGNEIPDKAYRHNWLAEDVTEDEILAAQRLLAQDRFFVEPASATTLAAAGKLRAAGRIGADALLVLMLTGAGLKDMGVVDRGEVLDSHVDTVGTDVAWLLTAA